MTQVCCDANQQLEEDAGPPLSAKESDFAAAIEKMQTYIDMTTRKHDTSNAGLDHGKPSAAEPVVSGLDSKGAEVKRKVTAAQAASAIAAASSSLAPSTSAKSEPSKGAAGTGFGKSGAAAPKPSTLSAGSQRPGSGGSGGSFAGTGTGKLKVYGKFL